MLNSRTVTFLLLTLSIGCLSAFGQQSTSIKEGSSAGDDQRKTGFSLDQQLTVSSNPKSLTVDSSVGYAFKYFGIDVGMPFTFTRAISATAASPAPATATPGNYNNAAGNAYMDLTLTPSLPVFNFSSVMTGMAPSGSKDKGLNTGRFTFDWSNHVDVSIWKLSPFLSGGISNTIQNVHISPLIRVKTRPANFPRPYTTLGLLRNFGGGLNLDVTDSLTLGASLYAVVPKGQQKIFSQVIRRSAVVTTVVKGVAQEHRQTIAQLQAVAVGTADDVRDNGFSASSTYQLPRNVKLDLGFTRSVPYAANIVTLGVSFDYWALLKKSR